MILNNTQYFSTYNIFIIQYCLRRVTFGAPKVTNPAKAGCPSVKQLFHKISAFCSAWYIMNSYKARSLTGSLAYALQINEWTHIPTMKFCGIYTANFVARQKWPTGGKEKKIFYIFNSTKFDRKNFLIIIILVND